MSMTTEKMTKKFSVAFFERIGDRIIRVELQNGAKLKVLQGFVFLCGNIVIMRTWRGVKKCRLSDVKRLITYQPMWGEIAYRPGQIISGAAEAPETSDEPGSDDH